MAITANTHRQVQEREARGYQWVQSGVPPTAATIANLEQITEIRFGSHRATIEAYSRGYQFFQAGIFGAPSHAVTTDAIARVEWKTSLSRDVLTPDEFASSSPHIPVVGGVFVRQEQPSHPTPRRLFGSRGPNAIPPIFASVFVQQEQGQKTGGYQFFQTGIVGVPSHTITKDAASGIEWKTSLSVSPQTPAEFASNSVHIPVVGGIFVRQEQPSHPTPRRLFGSRGPDAIQPIIVPPIFASVFVTQEQGQKTGGYQFFQSGTPPTGLVGPPQIGSVEWGSHRATIQSASSGFQFFQAGVRGVAPKVVVSDAAVGIEWGSSLSRDVPIPLEFASNSLHIPVVGGIFVKQEQIQKADGYQFFQTGVRGVAPKIVVSDAAARIEWRSLFAVDNLITTEWTALSLTQTVDASFPIYWTSSPTYIASVAIDWISLIASIILPSIDYGSIERGDVVFTVDEGSGRTADLNAQFQISSNINSDWSIPVDWSATTHIEFVDGNFPIEFLPTQSFACLFSLAWTTGLGRTKGAATEAPQIFRHPYFKQ